MAITNPASLIEVEIVDGFSLSGFPTRFGVMHAWPLLSVHPKSVTLLRNETLATAGKSKKKFMDSR